MKTKNNLLLLSLIMLLSGCGQKFCPGFPDEYTDYFPYTEGETIKFIDEKNKDTLLLGITHLWKTPEHWEDKCGKCDCGAQLLNLQLSTNMSVYPYINIECIIIYNNTFNFHIQQMHGISPIKSSTYHYDSTNSETSTTVVITNRDNSDSHIDKITLTRNKGITSFYDAYNECTWSLVEN